MTYPDPQRLSADNIRQNLSVDGNNKIHDILLFETVTSTNDVLWQRWQQGHNRCAVCIAETQTAGRGRRGSVWQSPGGGNLFLSFFWPDNAGSIQHGLSLAIGITVINTLQQFGIGNLQLKWPNDVLYKRQKLAGILIESRIRQTSGLMIGLGINIALPEAIVKTIPQPVISLAQLADTTPDPNKLTAALLDNMIKTITLFAAQGLQVFLADWSRYDALHNQQIHILTDQGQQTALACGINENGELRYMQDNQMHCLSSSHVSIRFAS